MQLAKDNQQSSFRPKTNKVTYHILAVCKQAEQHATKYRCKLRSRSNALPMTEHMPSEGSRVHAGLKLQNFVELLQHLDLLIFVVEAALHV